MLGVFWSFASGCGRNCATYSQIFAFSPKRAAVKHDANLWMVSSEHLITQKKAVGLINWKTFCRHFLETPNNVVYRWSPSNRIGKKLPLLHKYRQKVGITLIWSRKAAHSEEFLFTFGHRNTLQLPCLSIPHWTTLTYSPQSQYFLLVQPYLQCNRSAQSFRQL